MKKLRLALIEVKKTLIWKIIDNVSGAGNTRVNQVGLALQTDQRSISLRK
jgi:hypothetical protein